MEHFHHAGGVPKLMAQLGDLIDLDAKTITGATLRDVVAGAEEVPGQDAIRAARQSDQAGRRDGGAARQSRAARRRDQAFGGEPEAAAAYRPRRGVRSVEDMTLRVDDPDLDVNADDVLVLRNAGPKGAPGMPEAGYLPIPKKLARGGVKDMVRISDARMSGTAFGTIVLHITPESAVGGPLALVQERRHDPARRRQAQHRSAGRRRRTRKAPRGAGAGGDAGMGQARLRASVQRDHPAGRRRLRFRFHARRGEGIALSDASASAIHDVAKASRARSFHLATCASSSRMRCLIDIQTTPMG